jgi:hypothetical protein
MLETYHDGTQEVVGTTYINDMNWDTGELTLDHDYVGGSWAIDTVNGVLSVTTTTPGQEHRSVPFRSLMGTGDLGLIRLRNISSSGYSSKIRSLIPVEQLGSITGGDILSTWLLLLELGGYLPQCQLVLACIRC